jgi:hypothetical protein
VLIIPGRFSLYTIVGPPTHFAGIFEEFSDIYSKVLFRKLLVQTRGSKWVDSYLENGTRGILGELVGQPSWIAKSTPTLLMKGQGELPISTSVMGLLTALKVWKDSPSMKATLEEYAQLTGNFWLSMLLMQVTYWGDKVWDSISLSVNPSGYLGKLGFKDEAAGKVRVFAMVDPLTQWILRPLHEGLFGLLRKIPEDGTFNQLRPLDRLLKKDSKSFFSYDLSAATDRLPIAIQETILSEFITPRGAELWKKLLVDRPYLVTDPRSVEPDVKYSVGQPMGALSSWAMLALTHHVLVQWSAMRAGVVSNEEWFSDYAILGDDIVIAHKDVAKQYCWVMDRLGVSINVSKSLVSPKRAVLEFAKRFVVDREYASPISFADFWVAVGNTAASLEFASRFKLSMSEYLSMLGYGYKAKGSLDIQVTKFPKRLRRHVLSYVSPSGPGFKGFTEFLSFKSIRSQYSHGYRAVDDTASRLHLDETRRLKSQAERLEKHLVTCEEKLWIPSPPPFSKGRVKIYDGVSVPGWESAMDPNRLPFSKVKDLVTILMVPLTREMKGKLQEVKTLFPSGPMLVLAWDLDDLFRRLKGIADRMDLISPFNELTYRSTTQVESRRLIYIKLWERYSRAFRSTKSSGGYSLPISEMMKEVMKPLRTYERPISSPSPSNHSRPTLRPRMSRLGRRKDFRRRS